MESDRDLQDALIAWQGGELNAGREAELLERLRHDEAFREAFFAQLWTLSECRIARSTEPRWLELMEEISSETDSDRSDSEKEFELRLHEELQREPVRFVSAWWRSVAAAALVMFAVVGGLLIWSSSRSDPNGTIPIAVLIPSPEARWSGRAVIDSSTQNPLVAEGSFVLRTGDARLLFSHGVTVDLTAPARLELLSRDRIVCSEGKLRTFTPTGTEGFSVETPQGEIRDLGTELGIVVPRDGPSRVSVLSGEAEISMKLSDQDGVRSALLRQGDRAEFDARSGSILPHESDTEFPALSPRLPELHLPSDYASRVLASKPQLYWRLDRIDESGRVPNEIDSAPALSRIGEVKADLLFGGSDQPGALVMEEPWPTPAQRYAIEFWFCTDQVGRMDLAALTPFESRLQHLALVELGGLRPRQGEEPGVVRYLLRWPPGQADGMNLYSPPKALPYLWHHVVAQQENGRMELFVNGISQGIANTEESPLSVEARWQFGSLRAHPDVDPRQLERVFSGRLAEIAVYDRLLSDSEIDDRLRAATRSLTQVD